MELTKETITARVNELMRDGMLSRIIQQMKTDTAERIVHTAQDEAPVREDLYMFVQALNALEMKLQEYVNDYSQGTY